MNVNVVKIPVSLSSDRCQICPSVEVVKWSSDHIISKLSSKEAFGSAAASDTEREAAIRAAMRRRIGIGETLLAILGGMAEKPENGSFSA